MAIVYRKIKLLAMGSGGAASRTLSLVMETQLQTNWCWAANGVSIGNYYHAPDETFEQCEIVNDYLNRTTCCNNPDSCNFYGSLESALVAVQSFAGTTFVRAKFDEIIKQIDDDHPVGTRIAWNTSGAHFTTIMGYDKYGSKIVIEDPWYGKSTISYASYPAAYNGGAKWTHTYFTVKQ